MRLGAAVALAAVALAAVALLGIGGPVQAAPRPSVPPDVRAAFGADVRADDVHEVFRFSAEFVDGTATTEPVVRTDSWLAAITRGDRVVGTMLVWRPDGGAPEPAGYTDDAANGVALRTVTPGETLVVDEPIGAFFAIDGTTVRPLNEPARDELPAPGNLDALQETVARRYAVMRDQAPDPAGDPGPPVTALLGGALGLVAVALAVRLWLRRRREAG